MKNNLKKLIFFIPILILIIIIPILINSSNNKNLIYEENNIKIYNKNEELIIKNENNFELDLRLIKDTMKIEKIKPKSSHTISFNEGFGDYDLEIRNTDYRLEIKLTHNYKDLSNSTK